MTIWVGSRLLISTTMAVSKNKLTPTGVQYIINTVLDELEKDASRRFAWCETSFLWRWLIDHVETERMKKLVERGRILRI
ncbi:unnamed protein product [Thelazia callipaeda]|uniref:Glyco_hydro_38N domain-containing protein n=1 Tax=Thelazia callipaeda TaxID=103827 RepID=A0A0N5D953_THECL|nr:unnamed protein product [Thelazia callipaeda]